MPLLSKQQLQDALQRLDCHFNWKFDPEKFEARFADNLQKCLEHSATHPNYPPVLNFLGYLYVKQGNLAKAEEQFKKCREHNPQDVVCLANLAHVYYRQGSSIKTQECLAELERLGKLTDGQQQLRKSLALMSHGYAYHRLYDYSEALNYYREAYDLTKDEALLIEQAKLLNRRGSFEEALALLEPLRATDQDHNPLLHIQLGRALFGQGNTDAAIEEYTRALRIAPNDEMVLKYYGKTASITGNDQLALNLLNQAIAQKPTTAAYHYRAVLYLTSQDQQIKSTAKGEQDLKQAINLCSTNYTATFGLADLYLKGKNASKYRQALQLLQGLTDPHVPQNQLHYLLGRCHFKLNNFAEARAEFYQAVTSQFTENPALHKSCRKYQLLAANELRVQYKQLSGSREYYRDMATVEFRAGKRDATITLCEEGLLKYPEEYVLYEYLGCALIKNRQYDEVILRLGALSALTPEDANTNNKVLLKAYLSKAQDPEVAIEERLQAYAKGLHFKLDLAPGARTYEEFAELYLSYVSELSSSGNSLKIITFLLTRLPESSHPWLRYRLLYKLLHTGKLHELSTQIQDESLLKDVRAMQRDEGQLTFHNENPMQLQKMREVFFLLQKAELDNFDGTLATELRKSVTSLIEEARKMLDYLFRQFTLSVFSEPPATALFPCDHAADERYSPEQRLVDYLEKKPRKGAPFYLGLSGFRDQFPSLFGYLLSLQPRCNLPANRWWLTLLYKLRNRAEHGSLLELMESLESLPGEPIDTVALAYEAYFGVEQIVLRFFRAYCEDKRLDSTAKLSSDYYKTAVAPGGTEPEDRVRDTIHTLQQAISSVASEQCRYRNKPPAAPQISMASLCAKMGLLRADGAGPSDPQRSSTIAPSVT